MSATKISWTDHTINPGVYGCSPAGAGCLNCYAAPMAARIARMQGVRTYRCSEGGNGDPIGGHYGEVVTVDNRWTGSVVVDYDRIAPAFATLPKRKPCRVFVTSMGDLFHEQVPPPFAAQVLHEMIIRPWQIFQVLTKRPERIQFARDSSAVQYGQTAWPKNIHLIASASTQPEVDAAVEHLLKVPAAVRGLSLEPLVEVVNLGGHVPPYRTWCEVHGHDRDDEGVCLQCGHESDRPYINWIIVGAESGPHRRPCREEWVRSIVEQCRDAGVPVFVKQLDIDGEVSRDPAEWPADLRVQEFPEVPR
jgi:protein gp37